MNNYFDQILKTKEDPFKIRKTTLELVKKAKYVRINHEKLPKLVNKIKANIDRKKLLNKNQFGLRKNIPQKIFLLDTVNFCFWAGKGEKKWFVNFPSGNLVDGWSALVSCVERAIEENIPILNPDYLASISLKDVKHIFRGQNQAEIPLLEKRMANLREAGKILQNKFNGNINNLLQESNYEADKIIRMVLSNFTSFEDSIIFENKKINFYKRAQIFAYDLFLLGEKIKRTEILTIFADYKLPQILRHFGLLVYDQSLVEKVDNLQVLKQGSREEVEIRAATIWACEILAYELGITPVLVDNVLWLMAQEVNSEIKPYHRVRSIYY